MKHAILRNVYPHLNTLITKILYLTRVMELSGGSVLLYTKSNKIKFIVFIAACLSRNELFIARDRNDIIAIKQTNDIGIVLSDPGDNIYGLRHVITASIYCHVAENLLFNRHSNFKFLRLVAIDSDLFRTYTALNNQSFKDERKSLLDRWMMQKHLDRNVLTMYPENVEVTYTMENINHMYSAIDADLVGEKDVFVQFGKTEFEQSFIYFLYFFLRGQLTDVAESTTVINILMNSGKKLKKIIFVSNDHLQKIWGNDYKFKVYSKLNRFLIRWKLTKWIAKFTYQSIINLPKRDELIFINPERSLDALSFLDHARTKVSVIYGTPADGYTLGINRYTDKKLRLIDNSFRVMDYDSSIKIVKDTINRLYLGGKRIPTNLQTIKVIQSKSDNDKYYRHDAYCDIKGEILTVNASSEDLYYDGNIIIDVGTKRRSLMEIPFLRRAEVFKLGDIFYAVVELDLKFVEETFETPHLSHVKLMLSNKIKELNSHYADGEHISKVVVSSNFLKVMHGIQDIISKKNYIEYLNQQPFNPMKKYTERVDVQS